MGLPRFARNDKRESIELIEFVELIEFAEFVGIHRIATLRSQ